MEEAMPYASGRTVHDADAHIMEVPGFLEGHLETKYRATVTDTVLFPRRDGFHGTRKADVASAADFDDQQIMLRKTGMRSAPPPSRTGPARSTCWVLPAS